MVKIAGCAGHGLYTAGKQDPDGIKEWTYNNRVMKAFEDELKNYNGVQFLRLDDSTGKRDVPLQERTDKANRWGADIYISFHHNAFQGKWGTHTGSEVFCYKGSKESEKLAALVHKELLKHYGLRDRGVKAGNGLWILRKTKMPAILVEGGFMDSTIDIKKLRNDKVLEGFGRAAARTICENYFSLKRKSTPQPQPSSSDTYTVKKGDTLWAISRKYGMTVDELKKLNGLKSDLIHPGQKLKVKGKTSSKPSNFKVGQKVKVKKSASKYATGQNIPNWVKGRTYTIQQVKSDRVLLKEIVSWVYKKDVE